MLFILNLTAVVSETRVLNISYDPQNGEKRVFLSVNVDDTIARAIEPSNLTLWDFEEFSEDGEKKYRIAANKDPISLVLGVNGEHALVLKSDSPELRWVIHALDGKKVMLQLKNSCLTYHDSKFHVDNCDPERLEQQFRIEKPENEEDLEKEVEDDNSSPDDESEVLDPEIGSIKRLEAGQTTKKSRNGSTEDKDTDSEDLKEGLREKLRKFFSRGSRKKQKEAKKLLKRIRQLKDEKALESRVKPIIEKLKSLSMSPSTSTEKNFEFKTLLQPLRYMNTTVIKTVFTTKVLVHSVNGTRIKTSTEFKTLTRTKMVVVTDVKHIDEICTQTQVKNIVKTSWVTVPVSVTSVITDHVTPSSAFICTTPPTISSKIFVPDEESSNSSSHMSETLDQPADLKVLRPKLSFSGAIQKLFIQNPSNATEKYLNSPIQNQLNKIKSLKYLEKNLNSYTKNVMKNNIKVPHGLKNIFKPKKLPNKSVHARDCPTVSTIAVVNPNIGNYVYDVISCNTYPKQIDRPSNNGALYMVPSSNNLGGSYINPVFQTFQRAITCV